MSDKADYIEFYKEALNQKTFIKLIISKPKSKDFRYKKISFRLVSLHEQVKIKCVYTTATQDITKIYSFSDSTAVIEQHLGVDLKAATLFLKQADVRLLYNKKMQAKILKSKASMSMPEHIEHNKTKKRWLKFENNAYLSDLGVCDYQGNIIPKMTDKFKQIDKYIATLNSIIANSKLDKQTRISIVDMGSGKGYLSFALYAYLSQELHKEVSLIGVEQRKDLVDLCNSIAQKHQFSGLSFVEGTIADFKADTIDILIALHACDTATDDAIYKGIPAKADIIITAPCCHKQVRKQFKVDNELKAITQFGILKERQAEILTDTIRALVLESQSYKSQVFEFIADAHTHKNVMVVGVKKGKTVDSQAYFDKIDRLKQQFGVDYQYLEKMIRTV